MKDFKKISDKELDDLFRESARDSVPEYDESAWDKMESLLDESDKDKGGGAFIKPLIFSTIILLMLSLAYFTKVKWGKEASIGINNSEYESVVEVNQNEKKQSENKITNLKGKTTSIEEKALLNKKNKSIINLEADKSNKQTDRVILNNNDLNKINNKSSIGKIETVNNKLIKEQRSSFSAVVKAKVIIVNVSRELDKVLKKDNSKLGNTLKGDEPLLGDLAKNNVRKVDLEASDLKEQLNLLAIKSFEPFKANFRFPSLMAPSKIIVENESTEIAKWGLRLAISPDFSTVPENSFFKIGHNWAATIEYRINDHWAIQTGVIKSLKFYNANPDQYLWPVRWGSRPVELNQIDASCNMLDIPINIRYDISSGKNRWFAQTGLTSYLMLNEKYDYVFANNYSNVIWDSWEGKTGFYGAAVANFSFGLEKKFSKRLTFQAEPFLKIPLANVGFGKVKLLTTGLFISSKYTLFK